MNDIIPGFSLLSNAGVTSKYINSAPVNEDTQIIPDNIKYQNSKLNASYGDKEAEQQLKEYKESKETKQEIKEYTTDYTTLFIIILFIGLLLLISIVCSYIYDKLTKPKDLYYNPITINILKKNSLN